jgi:hypothetical protein
MHTVNQIASKRFNAMLKAINKRNHAIRTDYPVTAAAEWVQTCELGEAIRWWNAGVFAAAAAMELRRANVSPSLMATTGTNLGHRHSTGDLTTQDVIEALKNRE